MTNINEYKKKKELEKIELRENNLDEILGNINQDEIREENGLEGKLDKMDYLEYIVELGKLYEESKETTEKLKNLK